MVENDEIESNASAQSSSSSSAVVVGASIDGDTRGGNTDLPVAFDEVVISERVVIDSGSGVGENLFPFVTPNPIWANWTSFLDRKYSLVLLKIS